jgi:RNA polymerase sigma factor for flagellar operon FliA
MPLPVTPHSPASDPESDTPSDIVQQHIPLVYQVAWQVKRRIGDHVTVEELVSAGTLGLIRAVERFDPNRGRALSTFAIPRIRGAMLDDLRERDWVPRRVRRRMRALLLATRKVEQRDGGRASAEAVARELELPIQGYWRWLDEADGDLVPLQHSESGNVGDGVRSRQVADRSVPRADDTVLGVERSERLRRAIESLPPRMKEVLTLTYYEELGGRAIAELTGVSESRISQLKRIALAQLRESLDPDLVTE